jgi:hypothetical protein
MKQQVVGWEFVRNERAVAGKRYDTKHSSFLVDLPRQQPVFALFPLSFPARLSSTPYETIIHSFGTPRWYEGDRLRLVVSRKTNKRTNEQIIVSHSSSLQTKFHQFCTFLRTLHSIIVVIFRFLWLERGFVFFPNVIGRDESESRRFYI